MYFRHRAHQERVNLYYVGVRGNREGHYLSSKGMHRAWPCTKNYRCLAQVLPVQGAAKQTRDGCLAAAGAYRSAARPPVSGVRAVPLTIAGERNTFAPGDQRVVQRWICYRVLGHSVASRRFLPVRVMAFLERRSHLQTHHDDEDHRGCRTRDRIRAVGDKLTDD